MDDYIRLRQICLAAPDLQIAEETIRAVLGLEVCYRDERVEKYGLENVVFPIGSSFIEVVAPMASKKGSDTAVGRFLQRSAGQGGYIVICDCSEVAQWRARVEALGLRIANANHYEHLETMQLHPVDTGATMLEIDKTEGGEDLMGPYEPAGPDWQRFVRDDVSVTLDGVGIVSPDPRSIAHKWAGIYGRPAHQLSASSWEIALDVGRLQFTPLADEGRERFASADITVRDPHAMLERAARHGCPIRDGTFLIAGVWFRPAAIRQ